VLADTSDQIDDLARDYVSLLRTFGSAAENEAWTQRLLAGVDQSSAAESAWRRELAASWYLSTQRNDYAKLVMTKTHERRLESPAWQRVAENSKSAIESESAKQHLISLRSSRPGFYAGNVTRRSLGDLDITESGLSLRHTLSAADLGFEVDYRRKQLSSDQVALASNSEDNIEVSAYFGNSFRGGRLTAGVNSYDSEELNYTSGEYYFRDRAGKRELSSEIGLNEVPESADTNIRLNAKQDRAELAFRSTLGKREFLSLSGSVSEVTDRDTDERLLRGFGASVELGTTGSFGSNNWTMGVVASGGRNTRAATAFIPEESQKLALSASLFRGGIRANYPSAASPRYQLSAQVGHNWVSENIDVQLLAGAGFRLLAWVVWIPC